MGRTFNLNNSSDMRRFQKALEQDVREAAKTAVSSRKFDIDCPHCNNKISISEGKSTCPFCKNVVELNLDINF